MLCFVFTEDSEDEVDNIVMPKKQETQATKTKTVKDEVQQSTALLSDDVLVVS